MRNIRLIEAKTGIKIARKNINNLIYSDDIALMAESVRTFRPILILGAAAHAALPCPAPAC